MPRYFFDFLDQDESDELGAEFKSEGEAIAEGQRTLSLLMRAASPTERDKLTELGLRIRGPNGASWMLRTTGYWTREK